MKEIFEFRINYDFAHLLFKDNEGKNLGQLKKSVKVISITKDDPRFFQIPIVAKQIEDKYNRAFFFYWEIKRKYSTKELEAAKFFYIKKPIQFEPAGEECGTEYDERPACKICGANRKQLTHLMLKKGTIPKKDIAKTIAGELIVSEKFSISIKKHGLKGISLDTVFFGTAPSPYYQLIGDHDLELSKETIAGINPFDLSPNEDGEVYKCPKGHTIGLNLLSEPVIIRNDLIDKLDFFSTKQKIGVKRGLLRPEPLYICSQSFRKMVKEENLSGFDFEIAKLE